MYKVNRELLFQMLKDMPEPKKEVLRKALTRNSLLTSCRTLEHCYFTVYKEGFLIELCGTRCGFAVYANDNDGNFAFMRKPNKNKLHKLYSDWGRMNESDYIECGI